MLRKARSWTADRMAAWAATSPRRERVFVRTGQIANAWSYLLGTVYTHAVQNLIKRLRATGDVYRDMRCGPFTLALDVTDNSAYEEYFYGGAHRYEPALIDYVMANLRPGDVCIDVGANIGFVTLVAARVVAPGGRVIAFEPNPEARVGLKRLLLKNNVASTVEVCASALTDRVGIGQLYLTDNTLLSTLDPEGSPLRTETTFDHSVEVQLTTADRWLAEHQDLAPRIALIKIDVEGAEARVLAGMPDLLRRATDVRVVCETTSGEEFDRGMIALGFAHRLLDQWRGTFGNYVYERASSGRN